MNRERVIDALTEVARPIILDYWQTESCIASTRVGQLVLEYFEIESFATEVEVFAHNRLSFDAWSKQREPDWNAGAWAVGIKRTPIEQSKPGSWPGAHLVLLTSDFLIDLSVDQLARPKKGIQAQPLAVSCDASAFVRESGTTLCVTSAQDPFTALLWRYLDPQDRSYLDAPDWRDRKRFKEPVGRIIREVRASL